MNACDVIGCHATAVRIVVVGGMNGLPACLCANHKGNRLRLTDLAIGGSNRHNPSQPSPTGSQSE